TTPALPPGPPIGVKPPTRPKFDPEPDEPKATDAPKADPSKQSALSLVPADAVGFGRVNAEAFFKSPGGQKVREGMGKVCPNFDGMTNHNFGVKITDYRDIVLVAKTAPTSEEAAQQAIFLVFDFAVPVAQDKIVENFGGKTKTVDGHTLMEAPIPQIPSILFL